MDRMNEHSPMSGLADLLEITTTVEHESEANRLAMDLVTQKLAACVQILGPIQSIYEWNGSVQNSSEFGLKLKVAPDSLNNVVSYLKKNHPYDLPEIIVHQVKASPEYADWVQKQRT